MEERREVRGDDLAINFFIMPAIRNPRAKNRVDTHTKLTVAHVSSPLTYDHWNQTNIIAVIASANDIKKKSCAFMFPHYSLLGSKILLFWMLSSVRSFYKKLLYWLRV